MNVEDSKLYNIEFVDRTDYLYAYVSGDKHKLDIVRQYWREIADECRRTKCSKLLIVKNIKEVISKTDMYQIASEVPSMGFFGIKIAFVDQYVEQYAVNEFGELVANNRGIYIKVFNTVEEAEKWLLSK
jgi:hypothetical protein